MCSVEEIGSRRSEESVMVAVLWCVSGETTREERGGEYVRWERECRKVR